MIKSQLFSFSFLSVYLPNRTLCCVDFAFGNVIINAQVRVHNVAEAVALGNGTGSGNVLILAPFLARTCGRNAMKLRPHHPPTLALFRTSCKWMQRKWNEFVRAAKTQPTSCNESCEHFTNGLQLMSADVSKKNTASIYIVYMYASGKSIKLCVKCGRWWAVGVAVSQATFELSETSIGGTYRFDTMPVFWHVKPEIFHRTDVYTE